MNIMYVGPYYINPVTGANTVHIILKDFIEALEGETNVFLLTSINSSFIPELEGKYGIKVIAVNRTNHSKFSRFFYILAAIKAVSQYNLDVITNTFGGISFGFDAVITAKLTGKKSVVMIAGNEIKSRFFIGCYRGIIGKVIFVLDKFREWVAVNLADGVIGVSPWEVERLKKVAINDDKVFRCPRGIDLSIFSPSESLPLNIASKGSVEKNPNNAEKKLKVLYIGRKSAEKGYEIVIKAAGLLEKRNKNIEFTFAGDFEKSVTSNCNFIGYVSPPFGLKKLYEEIDVVVLASRTEGFPQVIGEAMAMGKTCIVSRHIFEGHFEDNKHAIFCELDPEDVAEKILMVYKNPKIVEQIGKYAIKYAADNLDRRIWKKVYKDIFNKMS